MATTAPAAVGDTVTFTAFTAANPSVATASTTDVAKLAQGDTLTLTSTAGDTLARAAVDGTSVEVGAITGTDVSLVNLDLSANDVTGLAATADVTAAAPAPSPAPSPSPPPAVQAEVLLTSKPSPGVGTLPVEPNPEDTLPGTRFADDQVPDPENPTGPALDEAAAQKLRDDFKARQKAAMKVLGVDLSAPPPPAPAPAPLAD